MDKILCFFGGFSLCLTVCGVCPVWAFLLVVAIILAAMMICGSIDNWRPVQLLPPSNPPMEEPLEEKHIGFENPLMRVDEE